MLDSILAANGSITTGEVAICTAVSLVSGLVIAFCYMFRNNYSKNMVVTLAILPTIIQAVIMLVNGNLGTGVAVAGAFSLIRFRSVPGSARDIISIFVTMAVGLAAGMGYVTYAIAFTVVVGAVMLLYYIVPLGERGGALKSLKITVPETLDYTTAFNDVFAEFTSKAALDRVRTTNLGSLFELHYTVALRDPAKEKAFLDGLRCRNSNLNISLGIIASNKEEL